ncbi:MAG: SOS response-associated peptidase [Firmicutes bacterium]|nr:SOS response-associated peptidase [Bacillota bacterium]
MCGRFALVTEKHILEMLFELDYSLTFELKPRYNIAPTQQVPVIRLSAAEEKRELAFLKWGLVPFWARDAAIGNRLINARAETAHEKPAFRDAYKKRRLLVPASGFYEWKSETGGKQPYFITAKSQELISLAGLWERWDQGLEQPLETFTILTTEPNPLVAELHNRMPVIIPPQSFDAWLDPLTTEDHLQEFLKPYPEDQLTYYPVSRLVNKPSNDLPELIRPL